MHPAEKFSFFSLSLSPFPQSSGQMDWLYPGEIGKPLFPPYLEERGMFIPLVVKCCDSPSMPMNAATSYEAD